MPASLGDLAKRLVEAGKGGVAPAAAGAEPRRGFSELTLRVLGRLGTLPHQIVAVFTGWKASVGGEDGQLMGECIVDCVRHGAAAPDPATEAYGRAAALFAGLTLEGWLAKVEERLEKKRKESEGGGAA